MTIVVIILSAITSILAFNNPTLFSRMQFNAYEIKHKNQYHRFFTYGLIHADWIHLLVNMLVLYSFGGIVETYFQYYFGLRYLLFYILLYVGGLLFSSLYDFGKQKDNIYYNAVGASGAVSAIVFSSILFQPLGKIYFLFLPIGIPAFLFGILYLIYSAYMAKRSNDNIGHSAHFWGAVYGLAFTIISKPVIGLEFLNTLFG